MIRVESLAKISSGYSAALVMLYNEALHSAVLYHCFISLYMDTLFASCSAFKLYLLQLLATSILF